MRTEKTQKTRNLRNFCEKDAWQEQKVVCGIDEVGRGCLAGPLVIAAVIIPSHTRFPLLKDSKILTESQRDEAFAWLQKKARYAYATISWREIDTINIHQATIRGMKKSLAALLSANLPLAGKLKYILIDGNPFDTSTFPTPPGATIRHFTQGESISASIAAASIVAKVIRDRLMKRLDPLFPAIRLHDHKGYGTAIHLEQLRLHGRSIIHRSSFLHKVDQRHHLTDLQQTIFEEE